MITAKKMMPEDMKTLDDDHKKIILKFMQLKLEIIEKTLKLINESKKVSLTQSLLISGSVNDFSNEFKAISILSHPTTIISKNKEEMAYKILYNPEIIKEENKIILGCLNNYGLNSTEGNNDN